MRWIVAVLMFLPALALGDGPVFVAPPPSGMNSAGIMSPGTCITLKSPDGTKTMQWCLGDNGVAVAGFTVSGGSAGSGGNVRWSINSDSISSKTAELDLRTNSDAVVTMHAANGNFLALNRIVNTTLLLSLLRADVNTSFSAADTGIWIGKGDNTAGTQTFDIWTHTSGNSNEVDLVPKFNPASGSGQLAVFQLNPTFTGTSSGTSPTLAIAANGCTTGGVCPLIDAGTSTTDYYTGFTRKFRVENDGTTYTAPNQLTSDVSGTGVTKGYNGVLNAGTYKVTIDRTAWNAAALSQDINIGVIGARAKITRIYADTTVAYAGPAGTLTLSIGTTTGGTQLLLGHDVKTGVVTKGLADADLGASITRAAAIQGGFIPSWSATTTISARLVSSSGNLSTLTTGSTTYYITIEVL